MTPVAAVEPLVDLNEEERALWHWHYDEACNAGLSRIDARTLADLGIEASEVRRLAEAGCPPELILKLLV